ncbi:MAG: hypothetical protein CVV64_17080 [Candidatus Wallbacteria bacterium HGW-Wallbacteria-1]|jgi:hypothetical protein|uniref:Restriction endonuclease type IV Mrr domain-containing protein n=1 Tax=Candidatus Wallbacteria bacterium HGW-Wallbacteria-1 TaxID=2013854 RepID=A0A2N1PKC4_9BACT|nr:MAG: hypothetical protein CVV64_17080 [Candidatus Wallbacteria bacterium HGW-Wallbacteria-1]
MANVYWLDSNPVEISHSVDSLRKNGHLVNVFQSEKDFRNALFTGLLPDIIIQDLHRKNGQNSHRKQDRTDPTSPWQTGWRFYEDFLRVNFWATFERLVVRLLQDMGYQVEHTQLTHDGGVDIWALHHSDLGDVMYAIDAKKYNPNHILGPEPVRAIYGVTQMKHASVGMIVTTARIGPEAQRLADQYRYQLSLKDFDALTGWIKNVNKGI